MMAEALGDPRRGKEPARHLRGFLDYVQSTDPAELRREYIDLFDLSRKQTLYLSYWTDGDTRRRGSTLGEFKQLYRNSGMLVNLRGELPDHLPILLEFAARVDPAAGTEMLTRHRPALEMMRLALEEQQSRYADVLVALGATLPGASAKDRGEALAMQRSDRPVESVGLDPYDPRLLPIVEVS